MRKILLVTLLAVFAVTTSNAQIFKFGAKAGYYTSLDLKDVQNSIKLDNNGGYHIGLQARLNLPIFFVQPELIYSINRFDIDKVSLAGVKSKSVSASNLDVPILFGWKPIPFVRVNAGPVFSLALKKPEVDGIKPNLSNPSTAYTAGLGVDLFNFTFDVRYNGKFSSKKQTISMAGDVLNDVTSKRGNWMFSVGYFFFSK